MAGNGPAPKDPAARRNKTPPQRGEWIDLPPELTKSQYVLPALPKKTGKGAWCARTKAAWAMWRKDPATTAYGPAEIQSAIELAHLHDAMARPAGDLRLAAEIRLRMDGLGLTAKGKRDLRWRTKPPGTVADLGAKREEGKTPPRRRLRAVEPVG